MTFTPVYVFPHFDSDYKLVKTERRTYSDELVLYVDKQGRVLR